MFKIFAAFAFGVAGASAVAPLDSALPPIGPNAPAALIFAKGDSEIPGQSTKGGRPNAANATSGKQQRLRKASKHETDDGFCECSDERVRTHCLIYMKLRGDRS